MKKVIFMLLVMFLIFGCSTESTEDTKSTTPIISSSEINIPILNTHTLNAKIFDGTNSNYLVVMESGLGDNYSVWEQGSVAGEIAKSNDVLIYSRAGYGKSSIDNSSRNIDRLRQELEIVINQVAKGRKVVLIGHSLGGVIIRDYAIKNPSKTAGLLFVDPSHELYNEPTLELEDDLCEIFGVIFGVNFGSTREARELMEDFAYAESLGNLPDIPTIVLTSMKQDANNTASDKTNNKTRQDWYNAHESLKKGVSSFTHIQTLNSGHYIMREEPNLVISNFNLLMSKL